MKKFKMVKNLSAVFIALVLTTLECGAAVFATDYSSLTLSEEEIQLAVRLTYFETEGEPLLCKCAFAAVIFNRVLDRNFPNSVEGVVYDAGAFRSVERKDFQTLDIEGRSIDDEIAVRYTLRRNLDSTSGALFVMKKDDLHLWKIRETLRVGDFVFGKVG